MKHSLNKGTVKESILANFSEQQNLEDTLNNKQDKLVSGTNIKTINGETLLGSGNITIEGGGGSAQVFVDVDSLPTENINSDVIYRLLRMCGIINDMLQTNTTVRIVDTLPTTGENCTDGSNITVVYYNKSDDSVYGYLDATFGAAFGVPAGWYPAANLLQLADIPYGGVADSTVGLESGKYYFVKEYDFYIYKGKWIKLDNDIVFQGEGLSSVVMNDLGNVASGDFSHAEGSSTTASGSHSHAEGTDTIASGDYSHAEGVGTEASGGYGSHAEGQHSIAFGMYSHAEGYGAIASGEASHAEGGGGVSSQKFIFTRTSTQYQYTSTSTLRSGEVFTNDNGTYAKITVVSETESPYTYEFDKDFTTTEGETVELYIVSGIASGYRSHAEGSGTTASGYESHAEGNGTIASGNQSHAEGDHTTASGYASHAEGSSTTASGYASHAEGNRTIASGENQHVQGKYNIEDTEDKYAHIVGNGTGYPYVRSNAHTLDWDGNAWFKGNVRVGGTSWDDATELGSGGGSSGTPTLVGTYTFNDQTGNTVGCSSINATDLEKNHIYFLNVTIGGNITMGFMFFLTNTGLNYMPTLMAKFTALGVDQHLLVYATIGVSSFTVWFIEEDFTFFSDVTFTQNIMNYAVIELYKL